MKFPCPNTGCTEEYNKFGGLSTHHQRHCKFERAPSVCSNCKGESGLCAGCGGLTPPLGCGKRFHLCNEGCGCRSISKFSTTTPRGIIHLCSTCDPENPGTIPCPFAGCGKMLKSENGRDSHMKKCPHRSAEGVKLRDFPTEEELSVLANEVERRRSTLSAPVRTRVTGGMESATNDDPLRLYGNRPDPERIKKYHMVAPEISHKPMAQLLKESGEEIGIVYENARAGKYNYRQYFAACEGLCYGASMVIMTEDTWNTTDRKKPKIGQDISNLVILMQCACRKCGGPFADMSREEVAALHLAHQPPYSSKADGYPNTWSKKPWKELRILLGHCEGEHINCHLGVDLCRPRSADMATEEERSEEDGQNQEESEEVPNDEESEPLEDDGAFNGMDLEEDGAPDGTDGDGHEGEEGQVAGPFTFEEWLDDIKQKRAARGVQKEHPTNTFVSFEELMEDVKRKRAARVGRIGRN